MGAGPAPEEVDAVVRACRSLVGIGATSLLRVFDDISMPQWRAVVLIFLEGPMSLTRMADKLGVDSSTASRTCDRLVNAGLLSSDRDLNDRRTVIFSLTPRGRSLVNSVNKERRAEVKAALSRMEQGDRDALVRCMTQLADLLGEPPDPTVLWGAWR